MLYEVITQDLPDIIFRKKYSHDCFSCDEIKKGGQIARLSGRACGVFYSIAFSSLAISDGFLVTLKPHSSMMVSLASAVSAPPEIRAPA